MTAKVEERNVAAAVEAAHAELWDRFIGSDGLIHDYPGEIPTPEECREGRPNAIGWWSPIENGPMFTGLYLPAVCERAHRSGSDADRDKAGRLARGLLMAASVSDVSGFIARGVGTDGKCHYPLGSEDQTFPWFYGLHAYVMSGLPGEVVRQQVVGKMREVADALEGTNWQCPCDGAFKGEFRGDFRHGQPFRSCSHYLFILRAMVDVTGEAVWLRRYQRERVMPHADTGRTRLDICAEGYPADCGYLPNIEPGLLWIYVGAQGALARLARMESDQSIRSRYRTGLTVNADRVLPFIDAYQDFENEVEDSFTYANWREGYVWEPQRTQADAGRVSASGQREILGERKEYERRTMTHPLAAAAIAALAGEDIRRDRVERAICHYDYSRVNLCEFFLAEFAYYALKPS